MRSPSGAPASVARPDRQSSIDGAIERWGWLGPQGIELRQSSSRPLSSGSGWLAKDVLIHDRGRVIVLPGIRGNLVQDKAHPSYQMRPTSRASGEEWPVFPLRSTADPASVNAMTSAPSTQTTHGKVTRTGSTRCAERIARARTDECSQCMAGKTRRSCPLSQSIAHYRMEVSPIWFFLAIRMTGIRLGKGNPGQWGERLRAGVERNSFRFLPAIVRLARKRREGRGRDHGRWRKSPNEANWYCAQVHNIKGIASGMA